MRTKREVLVSLEGNTKVMERDDNINVIGLAVVHYDEDNR